MQGSPGFGGVFPSVAAFGVALRLQAKGGRQGLGLLQRRQLREPWKAKSAAVRPGLDFTSGPFHLPMWGSKGDDLSPKRENIVPLW